MKTLTFTLSTALIAGGLIAQNPSYGQQQQRPGERMQQQQGMQQGSMRNANWIALESLIGAKVTFQAQTAGNAMGQNRSMPGGKDQGDTAGDNQGNDTGDNADTQTGEIQDLVVSATTGDLRWAVISANDKTVAVPAALLQWRNAGKDNPQAVADLSQQELKGLAEFDLDKARDKGLENAVRVAQASVVSVRRLSDQGYTDASFQRERTQDGMPPAEPMGETKNANRSGQRDNEGNENEGNENEGNENEGREGETQRGETGKPMVAVTETATVATPVHLLFASKLDGLNVYAQNDSFGSVSKGIVDANTDRLQFLVVSKGGVLGIGESEYLVPFRATKLITKDDEPALRIDKSTEQLKNAAKYQKPDQGVLSETNAKEACSFYGVTQQDMNRDMLRQNRSGMDQSGNRGRYGHDNDTDNDHDSDDRGGSSSTGRKGGGR